MKNHWDSTKSEWKIWYKLKREETGLGWDYEKDTVVASDDWWVNYLQVNPDAAKFREKGIEHSYQLTALFKDGITTGNSAYGPSQGTLPEDNAGPCPIEQDTQDTQEEMDVDTIFHNEEEHREYDNNQETGGVRENDGTRKKSEDFIPPIEKRRKVTPATNMNNMLERICNAVESRAANSNRAGGRNTIKECIDLLNQMTKIPKGGDLYMFGCDTLFLQKELRELFVALGEHDLRLSWLQNRHMASKTSHP
ncbi:L10-interacting MYB domain-containing protein-like [Cornus florida]|uniref:L10-interacting MYB domain-containing protein-like n=1 Tax=Cornus florida TaxID=4283 RepID=UPI002899452B|nr:L10-interacting MYB domain-containing protein-like [Cornus florida]